MIHKDLKDEELVKDLQVRVDRLTKQLHAEISHKLSAQKQISNREIQNRELTDKYHKDMLYCAAGFTVIGAAMHWLYTHFPTITIN